MLPQLLWAMTSKETTQVDLRASKDSIQRIEESKRLRVDPWVADEHIRKITPRMASSSRPSLLGGRRPSPSELNANAVFCLRRLDRAGRLGPASPAAEANFIPVKVIVPESAAAMTKSRSKNASPGDSIDILSPMARGGAGRR
jgi:hypothetical protein